MMFILLAALDVWLCVTCRTLRKFCIFLSIHMPASMESFMVSILDDVSFVPLTLRTCMIIV